jgi:hypothetical protein
VLDSDYASSVFTFVPHDFARTGMPLVAPEACLMVLYFPNGSSVNCQFMIVVGAA